MGFELSVFRSIQRTGGLGQIEYAIYALNSPCIRSVICWQLKGISYGCGHSIDCIYGTDDGTIHPRAFAILHANGFPNRG